MQFWGWKTFLGLGPRLQAGLLYCNASLQCQCFRMHELASRYGGVDKPPILNVTNRLILRSKTPAEVRPDFWYLDRAQRHNATHDTGTDAIPRLTLLCDTFLNQSINLTHSSNSPTVR